MMPGAQVQVPMWRWAGGARGRGRRVLVCAVGAGNVAQLAGDLLVASLRLERAASLHHAALVPVCGADPYSLEPGAPALAGAADLYLPSSTTTTTAAPAVLLLRAPLVRRHARPFLQQLVTSLKELEAKEIIILTSSFAHEKREIMSSQFRYCTNEFYQEDVESLGWRKHDRVNGELIIHGGGFAPLLLDICKDNSIPALILFRYCSEGDNIPDAYEMVVMLSQLIPMFSKQNSVEKQLTQPVSWKLLFGGPPPREIY